MIVLLMSGCASTGAVEPDSRPEAADSSLERLEALYRSRKQAERNQFTEADVDFMTGMIAHHAQALVMSNMAPTHGASASIQTLAARIINAQKDEIATMQNWLRSRAQPVPEVHIEGTSVMLHGVDGHHGADHADMPGMLTPEQLEELNQARGRDFDRLFLTFMIQHHRGAVTMVDELFATDGAVQDESVFKLASDIHVDQITEIERMGLMLNGLSEDASH